MKLIKNLIIITLIITLAVTSIPFTVGAETSKGKIYSYTPDVERYYKDVENYIANGIREYKTSIDISQFYLNRNDLIYIYRSVMFDNPDIFYVDSAYIPYKYDNLANCVAIIHPQYIFNRSNIPSYIKKFNSACNRFISGIDSTFSDMQKALVIHDRIVSFCKYKNENLKSFTAYNVLVKGKGICEGYSRAYCHLLSLVGVDSKCINNVSKSHCWNMVKLGGKWYHVDVTSDDPTPDELGLVRHKYFLVSDSKLLSYNSATHPGFKDDITYSSKFSCSSAKYNNYFFRNITSQIIVYKKAYYYMNNNYKNKKYSAFIKRNSSKKVIKVIKDSWKYKNNIRTNFSFCKLCEANNYFFFNSKRKIFRYNPKTGKIKRMMTLPAFKAKNFIGIQSKSSGVYAERRTKNYKNKQVGKIINLSSKNKSYVIPFLRYSYKSLKKNKSFNLKIYYGSGKITYKSSDVKIAKVSKKGRVKAKKKGRCTITAQRNGKNLRCTVNVF